MFIKVEDGIVFINNNRSVEYEDLLFFFGFCHAHKELGLRNVMNGNEKRVEVCENFIRRLLMVIGLCYS